MKFSISNIGWPTSLDQEVYDLLEELGYDGLEIAPTRCFKAGYDADANEVAAFLKDMKEHRFGLHSMQSLLFGIQSPIFSSSGNRQMVEGMLQKAVGFAEALGIPNMVFGSPSIRSVADEKMLEEAKTFFKNVAKMADQHNIMFSLEPNPIIYNTNFINTTQEALDFVRELNVQGLGINLDCGTVLYNQEDLRSLITLENHRYLNHVHISEPNLAPILSDRQAFHLELLSLLKGIDYEKTVSIEMKAIEDIKEIERILRYIKGVAIGVGVWNGN